MDRKKERYSGVLVRLPPELKAQLQAIADQQVRTVTNLARMIIQEYCAERAPKLNGADHKAPPASKARVPA